MYKGKEKVMYTSGVREKDFIRRDHRNTEVALKWLVIFI